MAAFAASPEGLVTTQLVEHFDKSVRLWPAGIDAERDGHAVFAIPNMVEADETGQALGDFVH